jgi:hypothetical protein
VRFFRDPYLMEIAAIRLKRLRESTTPKLSVRKMAEYLDMPASSYAFYEDPKKFKKRYLPVELAKSLTEPLTGYGVDMWDVLALAGLEEAAHPPGDDVASTTPSEGTALQLVTMQVALPSEDALTRMFEGLLLPLDRNLTTGELARMLAQRLPTAFAQLRDLLPDMSARRATDRGAGSRSSTKGHPESPR